MSRLMGWMPELGRCVICGRDLRGEQVWWSGAADGVSCADDRRPGSVAISSDSVAIAIRIFRGTVKALALEPWPKPRSADLRRFALELLERHLEERLLSAHALR
jgi:DNA repair protein RecO (recombination protein O)